MFTGIVKGLGRIESVRRLPGLTTFDILLPEGAQKDLDIGASVAVVRPKVTETTALGAAYAAGLATNYWKDTDDLKRNWGVARTWKPQMPKEQRSRLYASWQKAVTRSFGWMED